MKNTPEQMEKRIIADQLAAKLLQESEEYFEMDEDENSPRAQALKAEAFKVIGQILEIDPEHPILKGMDLDKFFKDWAEHLTHQLHDKH